jgi:hypothetical protein
MMGCRAASNPARRPATLACVRRIRWQALLGPLGSPAVDGRMIAADAAVSFRPWPLPLVDERRVIVGKVTGGAVVDGLVLATGEWLPGVAEAQQAAVAVADADDPLRPAMELCDFEAYHADPVTLRRLIHPRDHPDPVMLFRWVVIAGVALTRTAAFPEARLRNV